MPSLLMPGELELKDSWNLPSSRFNLQGQGQSQGVAAMPSQGKATMHQEPHYWSYEGLLRLL